MRRLWHSLNWAHPTCLFVVLISSGSGASPSRKSPLDLPQPSTTTHKAPSQERSLEDLGLRPSSSPEQAPSFYSSEIPLSRQSFAIRGGIGLAAQNPPSLMTVFGLHATWPRLYFPKLEVGADLASSREGWLSLAYKDLWFERTSLRPFLAVGPTLIVSAERGLAYLVDWRLVFVRASVGFEDSLSPRRSLRMELQALLGTESQSIFLLFGHSWGF